MNSMEEAASDRESYWKLKRKAKREARKEKTAVLAVEKQNLWDRLTPEAKWFRIQCYEEKKALEAARTLRNAEESQKNLNGRWNVHLVVDLDFDGLMTQGEAKSLAQQLSYVYATCRRTNYQLWPSLVGFKQDSLLQPCLAKASPQYGKWPFYVGSEELAEIYSPIFSKLIYLSPDSHYIITDIMKGAMEYSPKRKLPNSDVLHCYVDKSPYIIEYDSSLPNLRMTCKMSEIHPPQSTFAGCQKTAPIYIIGGFIDKNRYKGLTLHKASHLGIAHARLPFDLYDDLSKLYSVLTVNHIFEIFEKVVHGEIPLFDAMKAVIPKRRTR